MLTKASFCLLSKSQQRLRMYCKKILLITTAIGEKTPKLLPVSLKRPFPPLYDLIAHSEGNVQQQARDEGRKCRVVVPGKSHHKSR